MARSVRVGKGAGEDEKGTGDAGYIWQTSTEKVLEVPPAMARWRSSHCR